MPQTLSVSGAAFVRGHEGFVAKYYLDPIGVPTIGVGFTWRSAAFRFWWDANKPGIKFGPGATITRAEADDALRYLFANEYGKAVADFLGKAVPQHVFDGMASVVYNCGAGTLGDRWAAAAKIAAYGTAAELLRKTRTTANGKTLAGLVRRRKEEALLLERGIYTGVGASVPVASDPMADGVLVRGERGPAVAALILRLAALGHYDGVKDDVFGYGTEAALMEFQRANGLVADGAAGPKTLAALAPAVAPGSPKATPVAPAPKSPPAAAPVAGNGFWAALVAVILKLFKRG